MRKVIRDYTVAMKLMQFLTLALVGGMASHLLAIEAAPATNAASHASTTNSMAILEQEINVAYKALEQGKPDIAASLFAKALKKDPANRRGRFGLGTALIQLDKYKEALAVLEAMLKDSPNDYVLKNNIAWIYATAHDLSMRNGKRAIELAQDALMLNPTDCHVWSTLAEAYFISGRYDKALQDAKQALDISRETNADAKLVEQYQVQVERCRKAAESMSILE